MGGVLAFVEQSDGAVDETARELVTVARSIARDVDARLEAVVVGRGAEATADVLGSHGVALVHVVDADGLSTYAPAGYGAAIAQLIDAVDPIAVMASGTDRGNEVLAHVAARTDLPMAANCSAITTGDTWALTRQRWGGSLLEDAELSAPTKLLTVAPHAFDASPADEAAEISVQRFSPDLDPGDTAVRVVDREGGAAGVSLASAPVVVSGGRGVGSAEGFEVLEQLAGLLDGAVGCSRVATNNGWRSHSDQVGQTGTKIAPQLYVACGISGATQHWVGCKDAKNILAINTDPEAPLVTRGHYAVIGSLHDVLPAIVHEVRRRKGA